MSLRLAFFAVVAVPLVGMVFGLDWQFAGVNPPAPASVSAPAVDFPALPSAHEAVGGSNAPALRESAESPAAAATAAPRAQALEETAPPGCNVEACEGAYRSFRRSDCTYQPNNGPRRLCRKR